MVGAMTDERRYQLLSGRKPGLTVQRRAKMSVWQELCQKTKNLTVKEQEVPQKEVLAYCRLWNLRDGDDLMRRMIYHPNEKVKKQIEEELQEYKDQYDLYWDDVLNCVETLYRKVWHAEKKGHKPFETLKEAEDRFEKLQEQSDCRRYTRKCIMPGY